MASQPPCGYDPQGQPQGGSPTDPSQPGYGSPMYPGQPSVPFQQPYGAPAGSYPNPAQPSVPLQQAYGYPVAPVAYAPVMPAAPADPGAGLAIAGMILGIIGLVLFWPGACFLGVPSAVVGVVLSAIGLRSKTRRGMAIAGLVCGVVGLFMGVGWYILIYAAAASQL